jgi:hypothetical protein
MSAPTSSPASQLGDEIRPSLILADAFVGQASKSAHLGQKSSLVLRARYGRSQHLHRDVPLDLRIVGAIHDAHPASANRSLDDVSSYAGTRP